MTGTGRSDHREKKNREFDRKPRRANKIDLTPFTFLHPSRLIDLRIIKTGNRQQQQQELVPDICQTRERLNSTRRQRSYIVPWYSFRYRDAKEEMEEEDDRVEKDPIRSLCCTSSQYRIDGQCRYWRWHVLKHTPFIGAHVSVSMSVFRRPFLPTCLPRRDIRVVLPRCTVCRANRAHRKKFWPVETRNFDEFLFFPFSFDFRSRYAPFSIDLAVYF